MQIYTATMKALDFYFLCSRFRVKDNFGNKLIIVDVMTIHFYMKGVISFIFFLVEYFSESYFFRQKKLKVCGFFLHLLWGEEVHFR